MRVGLIVTLAPALAARLAAQGLDSMPALGVRPGNVVRVTLKEAGSVEGRVRAVSPDALLIAIGGRDSSVAVARIDSL